MRLIFLLALCLTICTTAFGGYETVVISELQTAKALAGVVTDKNGEALSDVIVREISPDGKTTIRSTITDSEGRWSLPQAHRKQPASLPGSAAEVHLHRPRVLSRKGRSARTATGETA